jgi:hypothetical protein
VLAAPPTLHVLRDNNYRTSTAERTGAVLTEGRIRAIAGRSASEDKVFERGLKRSGHTRNVSYPIGGEPVMHQAAGCLGQLQRIVVPMPSRSDIPRYAQCKLGSVLVIVIGP